MRDHTTNCRRCHTLMTMSEAQIAEAQERFDTLANDSYYDATRVVAECNDCRMRAMGWSVERMGGNLRQYVETLDVASGTYLRLMNEDGSIPITGACVLVYEAYDVDWYCRTFPSFEAFVSWYDTAEYVLPENGNGPEANGWTVCDA